MVGLWNNKAFLRRGVTMSEQDDKETIDNILKEAWEKIRKSNPSKEELENAKFFVDGKELTEGGEINIKGNFKREQYIYDHLFALVERAILACNGNDIDEVCHLVDAYDVLLAIGMAKDWIEED
jgi:hypothetical protein